MGGAEPRKDGPPAELDGIKEEFAAAMKDLRRGQRAAVEKAERAIDARKAAKLKKSIDDLAK